MLLTTPGEDGKRVTMLERTYRCTRFETNVNVPSDAFAMTFPDGIEVDDDTSGPH